jgi:hypothetical protein
MFILDLYSFLNQFQNSHYPQNTDSAKITYTIFPSQIITIIIQIQARITFSQHT